MISDQLTDEEQRDALTFRRVVQNDEHLWPALQRLMKKMDSDLIREWTDNEEGIKSTKEWLKGAREVCSALLPRIEELMQIAEGLVEEKKDLNDVTRSPVGEGGGSGDLAL